MPGNKRSSYQKLSHDKKLGLYTVNKPQKVLAMQDPNNCISYNTYLSTEYIIPPTNKFSTILGN